MGLHRSISLILNLVLILLFGGILAYTILRRKHEKEEKRHHRLLLYSLGLCVLLNAADALMELIPGWAPAMTTETARRLMTVASTLFFLVCPVCLTAIGCWILRRSGNDAIPDRFAKPLGILLGIQCSAFMVNAFVPFLFSVEPDTLVLAEKPLFIPALLLMPAALLALGTRVLWKTHRSLLIVLWLLTALRIYFRLIAPEFQAAPLICGIVMFFAFLYFHSRSVVSQILGLLGILFLLASIILGNALMASSFSTYLRVSREAAWPGFIQLEDSSLTYPVTPWLFGYWHDHPDLLGSAEQSTFDFALMERFGGRMPQELKPEDLEKADPEDQISFARMMYEYTQAEVEWTVRSYSLSDLQVILSDESDDSLVLFAFDGALTAPEKIGRQAEMSSLRASWENYRVASSGSPLNWSWWNFSPEDEFGFYQVLPVAGTGNRLLLCETIQKEEYEVWLNMISGASDQALILLLAICGILLIALHQLITRPIGLLRKALEQYRNSKDSGLVAASLAPVQEKSRNEIGLIAGEFHSLTQEIERYTREIEREAAGRARLQMEMDTSARIQSSMLPHSFPDRPEVALFASMEPARTVGGDFYDFFSLDGDRLALVIADVSDKGVPAALFMASAKMLIHSRAGSGGTPAEIFSFANRELCAGNDTKMFVTVWMGILDLKTGLMTCCNAGHENPAFRDQNGTFRILPDRHGMLLGAVKRAKYTDYEIQMHPGDALFVYTDGVPESANPSGSFWGMDRLEKALNQAPALPPEDLVHRIRRDIATFVSGAEQFDDLTMMCMEYRGENASGAET